MKASDKTKYHIIGAAKVLMSRRVLDKITVREITEVCDITRQTFYRHFIDKYDMANWYFRQVAEATFEKMKKSRNLQEGLTRKFEIMMENADFFKSALASQGCNSLFIYDLEMIKNFYRGLIEEDTGAPVNTEIEFLLNMYCEGSMKMTFEWVHSGMTMVPTTVAQLLVEAMPLRLADQVNPNFG